jgi:hypothetical protein
VLKKEASSGNYLDKLYNKLTERNKEPSFLWQKQISNILNSYYKSKKFNIDLRKSLHPEYFEGVINFWKKAMTEENSFAACEIFRVMVTIFSVVIFNIG